MYDFRVQFFASWLVFFGLTVHHCHFQEKLKICGHIFCQVAGCLLFTEYCLLPVHFHFWALFLQECMYNVHDNNCACDEFC